MTHSTAQSTKTASNSTRAAHKNVRGAIYGGIYGGILSGTLALGIAACLVGCNNTDKPQADISENLYASWNLTALSSDKQAIDLSKGETPATLTIQKDKFNGNAGCNAFFGAYTIDDNRFTSSGTGATRKLCAPESMTIEDTLMKLFADKPVAITLEGDTLKLELQDEQAHIQANFEKAGK